METEISRDIGEEVIFRLKELLRMLEIKYSEGDDGEEFSDTSLLRN